MFVIDVMLAASHKDSVPPGTEKLGKCKYKLFEKTNENQGFIVSTSELKQNVNVCHSKCSGTNSHLNTHIWEHKCLVGLTQQPLSKLDEAKPEKGHLF